jgi:hypothetical protein
VNVADEAAHNAKARAEAIAAGAWEPTPYELARLILAIEHDDDFVLSHHWLRGWSFYRRSNSTVHLTFCDRTGHAYLTVMGGMNASSTVRWATKDDALGARGLMLDLQALDRAKADREADWDAGAECAHDMYPHAHPLDDVLARNPHRA